jgi:hypothetical protein
MTPLQRSVVESYADRGHPEWHKYRTCTVGELMQFLKQFDPAMPVLATWEGQTRGMGAVEVTKTGTLEFNVEYDAEPGE